MPVSILDKSHHVRKGICLNFLQSIGSLTTVPGLTLAVSPNLCATVVRDYDKDNGVDSLLDRYPLLPDDGQCLASSCDKGNTKAD